VPPIRRLVGGVVLARLVRGLPPELATGLLGPKRVKSRRAKAPQDSEPPGPAAPLPPRDGHPVIEGEIEP
jgi:hypothetical protein